MIDHSELGADEPEAKAMSKPQVLRDLRGTFRFGHVAIDLDAGVDPAGKVGWLELVAVELREPMVQPGGRRLGVKRNRGLAKDFNTGRTRVGHMIERVVQCHHGAEVIGIAVQRHAVPEAAHGPCPPSPHAPGID